jgi:thymidylate synthase
MYILQDYDKTLEKIITEGVRLPNRTGTDCLAIHGMTCRYRIDERFPIPTKRKAFYKSIFAELLWMLSGSTNANELNALGSKIWDFWKDPEFEKKNGYRDGDLGPIYGHSFRHYGAPYWLKANYGDPGIDMGFDQISYLINELKINKFSRRALINLWDPRVMTTNEVKLPTCHYAFQILVDNENRMTGILTQRSGDWLPGVSANIFFYSAFMYMIGQQTGYIPYELVHNVGSAHVYVNQIDAAKEYLARPEIDSPKLNLKMANNIFEYGLDNFVVENYNHGDPIKVPIAI